MKNHRHALRLASFLFRVQAKNVSSGSRKSLTEMVCSSSWLSLLSFFLVLLPDTQHITMQCTLHAHISGVFSSPPG